VKGLCSIAGEQLTETGQTGPIGADLGVEIATGIRWVTGVVDDGDQPLFIQGTASDQVNRRDDLALFTDRARDGHGAGGAGPDTRVMGAVRGR